jgi:AAA15 family ATPase/GTPase
MIRKINIENYKSIERLTVELGRLNVFIGANGSGKSNILEAIAFASAAAQNKLDNEFLISRGIRATETRFMRSAFGSERLLTMQSSSPCRMKATPASTSSYIATRRPPTLSGS